mgnify:CR=1 FL=1
MRALTIRQPWATLLLLGVKHWETRSWRTDYRGPLAIHAAQAGEWIGSSALRRLEQRLDLPPTSLMERDYPLGAIIGLLELHECLAFAHLPLRRLSKRERQLGFWSGEGYAWDFMGQGKAALLAEPIPCGGKQGLWTPSDAIIAQLAQARRAA